MKLRLLPLLLLLSLASCGFEEMVTPSGMYVSTNRSVQPFTKVSVENGFTLLLTPGDSLALRIETYENMQHYVTTRVVNGTLIVDEAEGYDIVGDARVVVHVTCRTLEAITSSGGSAVRTLGTFAGRTMQVNVSGGGTLNADLDYDRVYTLLAGGSVAQLQGRTRLFDAYCSGGSVIDAPDFVTAACTLDMSGGSTADVRVDSLLSVNASGGSRVTYRGSAQLDKIVTTGGSMVVHR